MKNPENITTLREIHAVTQSMLFKQLWIMSNRRSFLSGLWLRDYINTPQFSSLFAHMLAKGQNQYPHFALYVKNVRLLAPHEHEILDHGTEDDRISYSKEVKSADWSVITDLQKELKAEYKKHFPTTHAGIINYKYSSEEVKQILSKLNRAYWTVLDKDRSVK